MAILNQCKLRVCVIDGNVKMSVGYTLRGGRVVGCTKSRVCSAEFDALHRIL